MRLMVVFSAVGIAVTGLLLARPLGSALGTPKDPYDTISAKSCHAAVPNDCRRLAAQIFHLDISELATVDTEIPGLAFVDGHMLIPKVPGKAPSLLLEFVTKTSPERSFEVQFFPHASPPNDTRRVGRTPQGRTFREARGSLGIVALMFYDEHVLYVVRSFIDPAIDRDPAALAAAERLVDAVHPLTHQVNP